MTDFNTSKTAPQTAAWGIAAIRVMVGIVFLMHGGQKLFVFGIPGVAGLMQNLGMPLPMVSATLVTLAEFVGGLALLLGFYTRLAALPIAFSMLVAVLSVHLQGGFFLPKGYEYALTLLVASLGLALTGSGAFALDNWIAARRTASNEARANA